MAGDARRASGGRIAATVAVSDSEMAESEAEWESESGSDSVSSSPDPTHPRHLALEKQDLGILLLLHNLNVCNCCMSCQPQQATHVNKHTPLHSMTLGSNGRLTL